MTELRGEHGWYTLRGEPIEGGQAEVWRAVSSTGAEVAVKRARDGARNTRAVLDEARSMRELSERVPEAWRWLVPVLDEGSDAQGRPFYVMPYYEATLADLLVSSVGLADRLDALIQAALALELLHRSAAHGRVLVHRDVKPQNYLVRRRGGRASVALSDFGIARDEELMARQTRTVMLTMSYAPPEQYLPLRAEPDASVDVFALAAVVWEGLTLGPPPRVAARASEWHGPEADVLLRLFSARTRLSEEDAARLEALRGRPARAMLRSDHGPTLRPDELQALRDALGTDELTELLAPVLARSLEPDPLQRLPSATSLRRALQEAWERLAGHPWEAPTGELDGGALPLAARAGAAATAAWGDDELAPPGPTMAPATQRQTGDAPAAAPLPAPPDRARRLPAWAAASLAVGVVLLAFVAGGGLGGAPAPSAGLPEAPAPVVSSAAPPALAPPDAAPTTPAVSAPAFAAPDALSAPAAPPGDAPPSRPPAVAPPKPVAAATTARSTPPPEGAPKSPTPAPSSAPPPPSPTPAAAPSTVVVSLRIEGYSMMAHGWDGGGATERGSSVRTLGPGAHVVELFHDGQVQRRVPVRVRESEGELVADVGDAAARVTCRPSQGQVAVTFHIQSGPRCR